MQALGSEQRSRQTERQEWGPGSYGMVQRPREDTHILLQTW